MGSALAIAGLVVNAGSLTYGIIKGEEQRSASEKAHRENMRQQQEMLAEQKAEHADKMAQIKKEEDAMKAEQAKSKSEQARDTARARQRAKAKGAYGRSDTILTGPGGLEEDESQLYGKKTVLGG